jgi:hypothetical protein
MFEVDFARGEIAKGLVRPPLIVEKEVGCQSLASFFGGEIVM